MKHLVLVDLQVDNEKLQVLQKGFLFNFWKYKVENFRRI